MESSPVLPGPVAATLESVEASFEVLPCDPAYADTAAFCAHYGYPPRNSANTIIVASRRGPKIYAACVIAADARLDVNRRVRELLGTSKLSFASPEEAISVTGMELGGVTVLGLPTGLTTFVDRPLTRLDYVILGAGTRSAKIKADPALFEELADVQIVDLALD